MQMTEESETQTRAMKIILGNIKYLEEVRAGHRSLLSRSFYVKLRIDDQVRQTSLSPKTNTPMWDESFYFYAQRSSILTMEVFIERKLHADSSLGKVEATIGSFVEQGAVSHKLEKGDVLRDDRTITFFVAKSMDQDEVRKAREDVMKMQNVPFELILRKIERFEKMVVSISEVHPYARIAWSALSFTYSVLHDQMVRDDNIQSLVQSLDDILSFLIDTEALRENPSSLTKQQTHILLLISKQVTECAYFISNYARNKKFGVRAVKHIVSDVDIQISQYQDKFRELKLAFLEHSSLMAQITIFQTKFLSTTILEKVNYLASEIDLNELVYAEGAACIPEKGCLPDTRQGILDEIVDWANNVAADDSAPRLLWLSGVAGSGKSAIAHSVAQRFQALNRLGSSFCFDVANQSSRRPHHLFSTISRDLAGFDALWKQSLWGSIKDNQAMRKSYSVEQQFKNFIVQPAQHLHAVGPIVIVIDALDECGDPSSRKKLLSILGTRLAELPGNFRFVVTSRPDPDILDALQNQHVVCKYMDTINSLSTKHDIALFIQSELAGKVQVSLDKYRSNWCELLVEKSEGLFQWAFTACLFIKEQGRLPHELLELLLEPSSQVNQLHALYRKILQQNISDKDPIVISRFRSVMSTVLTVKEPCSMSVLSKMCFGQSPQVVESILWPLGSLLNGVGQNLAPVQTLHTSFRDFLTNPDYSSVFYVDTSEEHKKLVQVSLEILNGLQFNMCKLPTSSYRNKDISNLKEKITMYITPDFSYACRFWVEHLAITVFDSAVHSEVKNLLSSRLLYWLEVLSLIKELNTAITSLEKIAKWSKEQEPETAALAIDAQKFLATFWTVIRESAPHIYISALPFAYGHSTIADLYHNCFGNTLLVESGVQTLTRVQRVLGHHKGPVRSVAISSNGTYIVSGSADRTLRLWHAEGNEGVARSFEGHTDWIFSTSFSPDGKHIVSGSCDNTIRIWDVKTGKTVNGPFRGHTDYITSVSFSPDGKFIVSSSGDHTIKVWDMATGGVVSGPFKGHTDWVSSALFLPDGKHIVSGSHDHTIRVWDVQAVKAVGYPLFGHGKWVTCLAVSSNGKYIVSGSAGAVVKLWKEEEAHTAVFADTLTFMGHSDAVKSVAFSPNGMYIASSSADKTIRLWNVETGDSIGSPFEGHTNAVNAVVFSPDNMHLISGSADKSVRLWDAEPGDDPLVDLVDSSSAPSDGHSDYINSVVFSHDGKFILSGSGDRTVIMWDAETGKIVIGPLKGHSDYVSAVAFSPDEKYIISASGDKTCKLWDISSGTITGDFSNVRHSDIVSDIAIAPNGKHIVLSLGDKTIWVYNIYTAKALAGPIKGHTNNIRSVAFSPTRQQFASASEDKTVRIWDAETGKAIGAPFEGHTEFITSVAYSPNGEFVISSSTDCTIRMWNGTGGMGLKFQGHSNGVSSIAFSPGGKHLVSGSKDNTLRLWDIDTGNSIGAPLKGHADSVVTVAFSPNGKQVLSGSTDHTIRVWDIQELLSGAETPHTLTDDIIKNGFDLEDGWAVGPNNELLFWVPAWCHDGLYNPRTSLVIGKRKTFIDYSKFVHGTDWEKCRTV